MFPEKPCPIWSLSRASSQGHRVLEVSVTPAAPPLSPFDADALEMFWWYPFDWEPEEIIPDYSDVEDGSE